jgi:peptidoglycan/xylan/chitin deacetylase (PgdA/CDA1 family)
MYHRVLDVQSDPYWITVSLSYFEEQMRVLKKCGFLIQMHELGMNLRHFSLRKEEIVITFDDGYSNNFYHAKPILERYEIPATFFIATGSINSKQEYWSDELERIILVSKKLPEVFEMAIAGTQYSCRLGIELSREQLHKALWTILRPLPLREIRDTLQQIALWAGVPSTPRAGYLPMASEELLSLANSSLFEIGAHTVTHPMLSKLSLKEQEEEISKGKQELQNLLNRNIESFSYPFGDFSSDTVKLVKRLEFKQACTVVQRPVSRCTNRFLLPRFNVCNWNGEQFEGQLRKWLTQ